MMFHYPVTSILIATAKVGTYGMSAFAGFEFAADGHT
jgi:hypothetical protein